MGPVKHEGGDHAAGAQAGNEGGGLPVAEGRIVHQALTLRSPAVTAHHVGAGPGFVQEDEQLRISVALPDRQACRCSTTSARSCSLDLKAFLCDKPSLRSKVQIALSDALARPVRPGPLQLRQGDPGLGLG